MWQLAVLALMSSAPAGEQQRTFDDQIFGSRRTLSCTWFTNFENSRFEQCRDAKGKLLRDGAAIQCVPGEFQKP